jgi:uncharacterized protein YndB with AHSA1/START domain
MLHARAEVVLDRSIHDVYEFLADFRNNPRWCPHELEVRALDGDGRTQRFENKVKPGPKVLTNRYEVTRTEPPTRIDFRGHNEMADFHGHYDLAEVHGGTRVVTVSNLASRGRAMRLLSPLMRPMVRATAAKQVRLLKEILERERAEHRS